VRDRFLILQTNVEAEAELSAAMASADAAEVGLYKLKSS
jgi:hypothetical protein